MMEWYEGEDRAAFIETAARYGQWLVENVDARHSDARVRAPAPLEDFNWEMVRQGGLAGLINAPLSEEMGGAGLGRLGRMVVIERMARGRAGAAVLFSVHWAGVLGLAKFSEQENVVVWLDEFSQKAQEERPLLCGLCVPAVVVNNDRDLFPELEDKGGALVLSGDFICPVHPALCDRVVIPMARTNQGAALLWVSGAQLSEYCEDIYPGSGLLEIPMARLKLDGFEVPPESSLASGGIAESAVAEIKQELYLGLASAMAGNSGACASSARDYGKERIQTGRPIFEHQEVRKMLENMKTLVEAARSMVFSAAAQSSGDALDRARRAFMFCGSVGEAVCLDAIQSLGGYGYMEDYGLERRLRDVKSIQCLLGGHSQEWIGESV